MTLKFVTGNENKFEEAKEIGRRYGVELEHADLDYEEIQADTLVEVVKPSAREAYDIVGEPCFVEDAGMFINSLNGFPGPYSSYVFKTLGNQGILRLMRDASDRTAEFRSVIGFCDSDHNLEIFEARAEGKILEEERGKKGFGYDPIFMPEGSENESFAEMSVDMKNNFSHRSAAIEKFVKWYKRNKKVEVRD